jgi:hypothetical protein
MEEETGLETVIEVKEGARVLTGVQFDAMKTTTGRNQGNLTYTRGFQRLSQRKKVANDTHSSNIGRQTFLQTIVGARKLSIDKETTALRKI